jgi:hypothetical protein
MPAKRPDDEGAGVDPSRAGKYRFSPNRLFLAKHARLGRRRRLLHVVN